jgi:hypothetical protein
MLIPTPKLYAMMLRYLAIVDSGDLSEERTEAHNEMMAQMKTEKYDFTDRDYARELALEIVSAIKALWGITPSCGTTFKKAMD